MAENVEVSTFYQRGFDTWLHSRRADKVLKRNSEQQEKRREKNEPQLISKPTDEVSLNNLKLLRLKFEKANC